jgi:hypothetical protein
MYYQGTKEGRAICQHSGPVTILKWYDKIVSMIFTYHSEDKRTDSVKGN